jgi:type VI secretion system protein ImpG
VRTVRAVRIVGGAACRGLRVTVELDREHFVGTGVYLFAAVLECFFGLYASINSFSQLEARAAKEEEPVRIWPPRAGEQVLL